ncbi:bacillithiol system redox-active protein YtxJ [Metabacillus sp. SLBN-84]
MPKVKIDTVEDFQKITEQEGVFLFFKNSLTCPIAQAAFSEFSAFTEGNDSIPAYYLNVQEARPLSNYIAETYGIRHESPQALLFKDKQVVWNESHWKITADSLKQAAGN